jgi:S1-C subfamily serine protease
VQVGDIITALDDQPVVGAASLEQLRNSYAPGDTVELTVYREGHYFSVPVTLI